MFDTARVIFGGILPVSEKLWSLCRGNVRELAVWSTTEHVHQYHPLEPNLIQISVKNPYSDMFSLEIVFA